MSLQDGHSIQSYVIQERIAGGGMGRIYRGIKKGLGGFEKSVVLKQLLPELTKDRELVELFFREAQIHAALDHANIVHIIDLVGDDRDYFIVMEYVRGTDLYQVVRGFKSLDRNVPLSAALFIGIELLKGLDYAHNKQDDDGRPLGVVHRDVSPNNVLVSGSGEIKITDFGIAKAEAYATNFFRVRGKAAYMSPEQGFGEEIDLRSDLYSAGVCLYELLARRRPLPTPKKGFSAEAHYSQPIPRLKSIRPDVPPLLDETILSSLEVDPGRRPQTAAQFLGLLEDAVMRQNLHYSHKKLSNLLKRVFGRDPAGWIFSGRNIGEGSSGYGRSSRESLRKERVSPRSPLSKGGEAVSWKNPSKGPSHGFKGREITSVSLPPFPWRGEKSEREKPSRRLPSPRSLDRKRESLTDEVLGGAQGRDSFEQSQGMGTHSPPPPPPRPQVAKAAPGPSPGPQEATGKQKKESKNVPSATSQGRGGEPTAHGISTRSANVEKRLKGSSHEGGFPSWLLWLVFVSGVALAGVLVFLLVVWAAK